jgi:hypothetical protein
VRGKAQHGQGEGTRYFNLVLTRLAARTIHAKPNRPQSPGCGTRLPGVLPQKLNFEAASSRRDLPPPRHQPTQSLTDCRQHALKPQSITGMHITFPLFCSAVFAISDFLILSLFLRRARTHLGPLLHYDLPANIAIYFSLPRHLPSSIAFVKAFLVHCCFQGACPLSVGAN